MKRATHQEETALEAVFSFTDAIDAIAGIKQPARSKPIKLPRPSNTFATETGPIWRGWRCVGENLIDGGGNRYGQGQIRAIFYNRQRIRALENTLLVLRPPSPASEPVQLALPLEPAWKMLCNR